MRREVPVTVRVPVVLKERVDGLAAEVGISSSAVWKLLIHRALKQVGDGTPFRPLDLFQGEAEARAEPASGARLPARPRPPLFDREGTLQSPPQRR